MPAYLIGHIRIKEDDLWRQYVDGVQKSLTPFDAKIVFRGQLIEVLAGAHDKDLVVVVEFFDQTILDNWFHAGPYQALIPLRDKAADVVITTYNAVVG